MVFDSNLPSSLAAIACTSCEAVARSRTWKATRRENEQMLELSFASAALEEPLGEDLVREPDSGTTCEINRENAKLVTA